MVRRGGGVYAVMPIFEAVVGLVRFESWQATVFGWRFLLKFSENA